MKINKQLKSGVVLSFWAILAIALSTLYPTLLKTVSAQTEALPKEYLDAIKDAVDPQPDEVSHDLTAIVASNPKLKSSWEGEPGKSRILVVTFASKRYDVSPITPKEPIWVTVAPELKNFCTRYAKYKSAGVDNRPLNLRLKQLLGLPPNSGNTFIVEIWVDPGYLKRPSLDPEIEDHEAKPIQEPLQFPQNAGAAYREWLTNLFNTRFNSGYPWTGLGYTYDWGDPKTVVGLSEFVIWPNSNSQLSIPIEVKQVLSTEEYCRSN